MDRIRATIPLMDLTSSITDLPKVGPILARKFERLGISTIKDLFYHAPARYTDYSKIVQIAKIKSDETVTIHAKMVSLKNIYSRRGLKMQIGSVEDATGKLAVVWFNQPFLIKTLYPGRSVSLSGKIGFFNRRLCLTSPDYELLNEDGKQTLHTGRLVPVYPETSGLSSKWIRRVVEAAIGEKRIGFSDPLPEKILAGYNLENLENAIKHVHFPRTLKEAEKGRERLAFNELLNLHLTGFFRKNQWEKNKLAFKLTINQATIKQFISSLPFKLTNSQDRAIVEMLKDLGVDIPMNRLLEGDVGSGKTVVAAIGAFAAFTNGFQTIVMAPTQILATQHYETLNRLFADYKVRISLITSDTKRVKVGRSDIFIGTHALIHKKVQFDTEGGYSRVALVVIDEQHRFGVEQRQHLIKKSGTPHILTMTATPIPRTIALTTYGDLDLSVLTEMPEGRQKVNTWIVPNQKREKAWQWIDKQIARDKCQVFWVCPLIEESEKETMKDIKAVTSEFTNLKSYFQNRELGLLHGRLKANEKTEVLKKFRKGQIDILVTTPVVEVGIDIPNATVMVIEASERFGLAQLHQLRGRVGRGTKKSYCLLFSNFRSGKAYRRLKAMEQSHSGFELAELDLKLRGPGEIFGTAQSGFPELKVASWANYELIKKTKELAEEIAKNPGKFPLVAVHRSVLYN